MDFGNMNFSKSTVLRNEYGAFANKRVLTLLLPSSHHKGQNVNNGFDNQRNTDEGPENCGGCKWI